MVFQCGRQNRPCLRHFNCLCRYTPHFVLRCWLTRALDMRNSQSCYFCGQDASTREHVPPKGFFPKNSRKGLITVPSCVQHNTHKSGEDEYLRMIVCGVLWDVLPIDLKETILRSVERKPLLAQKLINQAKRNADGTFYYDTEVNRVYMALEAVGRGLIFSEFQKVCTKAARVITSFLELAEEANHHEVQQYKLVQSLSKDLLLELPFKGANPRVFTYKAHEKCAQFVFYQRLTVTVLF